MTLTLADYGRIIYRLVLLIPLLILIMVLQSLALLTRTTLREIIPIGFHRLLLRAWQVEVRVFGNADMGCQFFVANHYSWFDVFPLGAHLPICFVAKDEMRHWLFLGTLARLQRSVFVNRKIGKHIIAETQNLYRRWLAGDNILIFPEATTTPGLSPLPFKGTFFAPLIAIAQAQNQEQASAPKAVLVQPISLCYKMDKGVALGRGQRLPYGWLGQVGFVRHFFYTLACPNLTIDMVFNPAIAVQADTDRKALNRQCYQSMRLGLDHLIMGTADSFKAALDSGVNSGENADEAESSYGYLAPMPIKE